MAFHRIVDRRAVIGGLAAALGAAVAPSFAQSGKQIKIGLLANSIPAADLVPPRKTVNPAPKIVEDGLRELGWVDGSNVQLIWKTAEGQYERHPALIDEFLRIPVDVLVVFADEPARIAAEKTRTVPIVQAGMGSLLELGIVKSLQRPGRNVTGMSIDGLNLGPKRLELLKSAFPALSRAAVLIHARPVDVASGPRLTDATKQAAARLGVTLLPAVFEEVDQLPGVFADFVSQRANGLLVGESPFLYYRHFQLPIHELATKHRLPAMWRILNAVESGALMAYAPDILEFYRAAPRYVDKILRGANAADIPIETPSKFTLAVNLRAAKAIGFTFPSFILSVADRIVE